MEYQTIVRLRYVGGRNMTPRIHLDIGHNAKT
nr:MAG TPA: Ribonuclease H-like protein [Caudoviricetes sp.]